MTSSLQILYFIAITLAPPGAHHVNVSGGSEVYGWTRSGSAVDDSTWVYDCSVDPNQVLINNAIVPADVSGAHRSLVSMSHRNWADHYVLAFDDAHVVEKNSGGYVYVVRPGAPNQKTYSFTFSK
jgi:hypothetical protein